MVIPAALTQTLAIVTTSSRCHASFRWRWRKHQSPFPCAGAWKCNQFALLVDNQPTLKISNTCEISIQFLTISSPDAFLYCASLGTDDVHDTTAFTDPNPPSPFLLAGYRRQTVLHTDPAPNSLAESSHHFQCMKYSLPRRG